jgi:hypothetical protein
VGIRQSIPTRRTHLTQSHPRRHPIPPNHRHRPNPLRQHQLRELHIVHRTNLLPILREIPPLLHPPTIIHTTHRRSSCRRCSTHWHILAWFLRNRIFRHGGVQSLPTPTLRESRNQHCQTIRSGNSEIPTTQE